jgi:hypothetical protein
MTGYRDAVAPGRLAIAFVIGAMIAAACASAHADPAGDRRAVADQLANDGRFAEAAAAYLDAYAVDQSAALVCNAGVAYFKANQLPRAQLYLAECSALGGALGEPFMSAVRANLTEIEAALKAGEFTPVDVHVVPNTALVAGEDFAPHGAVTPRTIWMAYGDHVLTVTADGYVDRTVPITARTKDRLPLEVTLDAKPVTPRVVVRTVAPPPIRLRWPIATTVATVAFGGLVALAHAQATSDATRAGFALNAQAFASDRDGVDTWNQVLGLAVGGAIAGAVASAYLWRKYLVRVDVEAKPGVAMLMLEGSL